MYCYEVIGSITKMSQKDTSLVIELPSNVTEF